jgi:formylglycine-generating enzyme required for sulfatase activity
MIYFPKRFIFFLLLILPALSQAKLLEFPYPNPPDGYVFIPVGSFMMGSPGGEMARRSDETLHRVKLTHAFFLQSTEVTRQQWEEVRTWAKDHGYEDIPDTGKDNGLSKNHPITGLSWFDAVKWLNAFSEKEGFDPVYFVGNRVFRKGLSMGVEADWGADGYRLPTEAEWEYACRAGTETAFYTGKISYIGPTPLDPNLDAAGWYWGNSGGKLHPVGQKSPNAWGLYDMIGNVWEWCWDWHGKYDSTRSDDPKGPDSGTVRIFRGGSWNDFPRNSRAAFRGGDDPDYASDAIGFRPLRRAFPRFSHEKAPDAPSLAEGGFAPQPAFSDDFDPGWSATQSAWEVATWVQNGGHMAPTRARDNGKGQLVQTVKAGEPYRGGSVNTFQEFGYGRWIARLKLPSVPGSVHSMFTKDWDDRSTPDDPHDGKKAEVDFEFLTYTFGPGYGEIHIAIHFLNKHHSRYLDIPLDFNPAEDFHEWGFDILPDRVVWHVDGKVIYTWEYTDFIDPNYEFFFNSWTRDEWVNGPPAEDAHYLIDWVKFFPLEEQ